MTPRVGRRHRAVVRVGGGLPVDVSARFPCRSSVARQRTAASRPRPNECRSSVVSNWSVGAGRRCKIRDDDEHQPLLLSHRRRAASHRCTAIFVAERADDGDDGGQEAQGTNWVYYQAPYLSRVDAVCPLSRSVLVDPVRSKKCGHVYSLKNIKAFFKKKQKCACFGCKVELDINDFERLDIDVRGAVWRRDDRDGRLLRL